MPDLIQHPFERGKTPEKHTKKLPRGVFLCATTAYYAAASVEGAAGSASTSGVATTGVSPSVVSGTGVWVVVSSICVFFN